MATIYRCDICGVETKIPQEQVGIAFSPRDGKSGTMKADVCKKCATKLQKNFKELRSNWKATIQFEKL